MAVPWRSPALALLTLTLTAPLAAQAAARPPVDGGFTESLGRPARLHRFVGIGGGFVFGPDETELDGEARLGIFRHLGNPVYELAAVRAEAYAGARGTMFDWGVRAQLFSPYLRFGLGIDYNGPDRDPYFFLTAAHPIRRAAGMRPPRSRD